MVECACVDKIPGVGKGWPNVMWLSVCVVDVVWLQINDLMVDVCWGSTLSMCAGTPLCVATRTPTWNWSSTELRVLV